MSVGASSLLAGEQEVESKARAGAEIFLISLVLLFLELACIRWFPAHVLFLTFFTNTMLLACFLGMSLGCLAARRSHNFIFRTPVLLALAMGAALVVQILRFPLETVLKMGNQASPQVVFFGNDYRDVNPSHFFIPIEVIEGFFFVVLALALVGPGQELGRALDRLPNRVKAYTLNILGSLAGIALFAGFSWLQLPPFWWFLVIVLGLGYFLFWGPSTPRPSGFSIRRLGDHSTVIVYLAAVLALASLTSGSRTEDGRKVGEHLWSPYYRIDYDYFPAKFITVNLIGHQRMMSRHDNWAPALAYSLPYLFERDSGGKPFEDALVIGAGSGNDVSRALQWGVSHVDAVEIDPVILRLGKRDHPDRPYEDPRVTTYLDDGRNFLRSSNRQYDLVMYALVDSLVLHSSYSDLHLESFLFTSEALSDVRRHVKPGGVFIVYNYFRQGWIVGRLDKELTEAFGAEPLAFTLPYRESVEPTTTGGFTMFVAGNTKGFREAFEKQPEYWLRGDQPPGPGSPDGFDQHPQEQEQSHWVRLGLSKVVVSEGLRGASDDWPFLYVRRPMITNLGLRGIGTMGGLALLLLYLFMRQSREGGNRFRISGRMFFLGAGFMLLETEAVVHMALLFGSTWMVNTVVFAAVLIMILAANLVVLKLNPQRLWPFYVALLAALALNVLVPLDSFLGVSRGRQIAASSLLVFTPILFAGVIFAASFGRSDEPDLDFGANVGGAVLGGLAEYASTLLGFQYLTLLAVLFYLLSAALGRKNYPVAVQ